MGDWLGTGTIATHLREYRPFKEARRFVRSLKLKSSSDWRRFCKSGKRPKDIPAIPAKTYSREWNGMGDWLGTGTIAPQEKAFRPFSEARKFVQALKIRNVIEWRSYCSSGKKPTDIPSAPKRIYRKDWIGYGDWLGTYREAAQLKVFRSFKLARAFVQSLKLKNRSEWNMYCRGKLKIKLPTDIPATPYLIYKNDGWMSWSDWLGNNK